MIRIVGQFLEDEKIIELYWVRDQRAITCSQQKYGAYCHKIAQNVLHNESDCEECMNDTWFRAWNSMPTERPGILQAFFRSDYKKSILRPLPEKSFEKAWRG